MTGVQTCALPICFPVTIRCPEYLGGSSVPVNIAPVAQTSASAISGSATPQGNLSGIGTLLSKSGFTQSFTEHGVIIGLA